MAELTERRLVARAEDGRYRIGLPLQMIGSAECEGDAVEDRGQCVIEDLAAVTGCRIRLGVLSEHGVVFMQKLPGRAPVDGFGAEATLPAYCTALGRVLLAFSPSGVAESMMERALSSPGRRTPTSPEMFNQTLAITRVNRMAINPEGLCCIAMPVFGPRGQIVASLGLTMRHTSELECSITALRVASCSLSRELAATSRSTAPPLRDACPVGAVEAG
jgi:DNA-binding IclR family transcriptional regulator